LADRPEPVDLTNCDREPIHILGAIQPLGFLLALTADWLVARTSANVADYLGHGPEAMIGKPLSDFLPMKAIHDLRNRTAILRGPDSVERLFDCEMIPGA
jgi:light-regulated signal transduction histidine kinase (bacteriophytochrome)